MPETFTFEEAASPASFSFEEATQPQPVAFSFEESVAPTRPSNDELKAQQRQAAKERAFISPEAIQATEDFLVKPISQMNPLTVVPRAIFGIEQSAGIIPKEQPFPLENGTPLAHVPRMTPTPGSKTGEVVSGVYNAGADMADFFLTPEGVSTMGAGMGPKAAQAALAAGFAGTMSRDLPEAATAAGEAAGNPDVPLGEKVRAGVSAAGLALLPIAPVVGPLLKESLTRRSNGTSAPAIEQARPLSEFGDEREIAPATVKTQPVELPPEPQAPVRPGGPLTLRPVEESMRLDAEETPAPAEPTMLQPTKHPVVEVPIKELRLSEDVPNFKADADLETGVVEGQKLEGKYERLGTGAITVYERMNGNKEVISGRHRFDLARRTGETTIPSQIVREADGFTPQMATILDAEMNIRDGQGTVGDYANYFRNADINPEQAAARGLVARAKGKAGWTIGKNTTEDVFALYRAGKINEGQAVAIGAAAPGDAGLQRVGSRAALEGKSPQEIGNFIQAVKLETKHLPPEQFDLFAADDSALKQAEAMAKIASRIQNELSREIKATDAAAKNATTAKAKGLKFERSPEEILQENEQLRGERGRWDNWALHKELVDQVRGYAEMERVSAGKTLEQKLDGLKIKTNGQLHAFGLLPEVWNTLIDMVKLGVRSGRAVKDAVDWAVEQFKQTNPGTKFDEAGARAHLEKQFVEPARQFGEKLLADETVSAAVNAAVNEYTYTPRSNETDLDTAKRIVQERGIDAGIIAFQDERNGMPGAVRSALGKHLIKTLSTEQQLAEKSGNKIAADELVTKQVALIDYELKRSTEVAQTLQAMRLYGDMSPTAIVRHAKRSLQDAGNKVLDAIRPAIDAVTETLNQEHAVTTELIRTDAEVNRAAREAVDEAIEQSQATHSGVIMELAEPFAQSPTIVAHARAAVAAKVNELLNTQPRPPGLTASQHHARLLKEMAARAVSIANGHYQGAEPGVTLKDKLRSRMGITEAHAARLARQFDEQFAKMVEAAKKKLKERIALQRARRELRMTPQDQISQSKSVWVREKQRASEALVKAASGRSDSAARTPLQEFAGRLTQRLSAQLGDRPTAAGAKLSDIDLLREAISNADKYEEVWLQVKNDIITTLYSKDPARLAELETVLEKAVPELFSDKQADRIIRAQLKDLNVNLGKALKEHSSKVDATKQRMADRVVDAVGLKGPKADALREAFHRRFESIASERKRAAIEALAKRGVKVPREVKQAAQRLIELSNLGALENEAAYNAVRERMNLPEWSPALASEITRQANRLQELPEGFQKQRATLQLLDHIARQRGVPWHELPMAFWYANVLSGPITHTVNTVSNAWNLGANFGIQVARNPLAAPQILSSLARGFGKGGLEATAVLKSGYTTGTRLSKFEESRALELTKFSGWAMPLNAWKYVTRALSAEDMFFYKAAEEMNISLAARLIAKREGLRGDALKTRTAEILGNVQARVAAAQAQAAMEGLNGLDFRRRVNEIIEQSRPEEIRTNARDYALKVTFNNEPYGVIGAIAQGFNWMNRKSVVTRFAVPFTNIVANVLNEGLNYVPPVGAARAIWGHLKGNLDGKPITDPEMLYDQWAKAAIGTGLLSAVALATAQTLNDSDPQFSVYGEGPRTKDQRNQLKAMGWIPNSIKIGKRYYSFAQTPAAIPLAILGNYFDAIRYKKLDEADALNRVQYAIGQSAHVILQNSFLDSLARIFELANRDSVKKSGVAEIVLRTGSSFVIPNALKQVDRMFDPTVYDANTVQAAMVAQVPFVRREGKPTLNAMGDPVQTFVSERFTKEQIADPLWKLLSEKQAWISVVDQEVMVGRKNSDNYRTLTAEERYDYVKESGAAIRKRLEENMDRIKAMDSNLAKKFVQKVVELERKRALKRFEN